MSFKNLYYYRKQPRQHEGRIIEADVCVYGGVSAGVIAALQLKRLGHNVVLAVFGRHIGGLSAGGLGATDIGNKQAIGGLSRQFYRDLGTHYGNEENWTFEPHVAEAVFNRYITDNNIPVYYEQHLESVKKSGNRITEILMEDGTVYRARQFIDATYEGDLLAASGVRYTVGRESNKVYGEVYNGIQFGHPNHQFTRYVDPYKVEGDPASGLCAGISDEAAGTCGEGDNCVQAYNFRVCLSNRPDNRIPFPCPPAYDPERYTLLARYLHAGVWDALRLSAHMPNGKTDTNNYGAFSSDNIGRNYDWPDGSYARREEIFQDHVSYNLGMLYFLANDTSVPAAVREEMRQWGLPADEFVETSGWPHELYVREARRMISNYVMTEHNVIGRERITDSVGLAAYGMDSHNCRRIVIAGRVINEGNVEIHGFRPYPIAYRSLCPREEECSNLLVPWCLSASHIAFGSIRMEPVGMVLGQSVAFAASLALRSNVSVQQISIEQLQRELRAAGQVLES